MFPQHRTVRAVQIERYSTTSDSARAEPTDPHRRRWSDGLLVTKPVSRSSRQWFAKGEDGVIRVLWATTALVVAVALSAMFLATQPNVIVLAPGPALPMRTAPVTTTPELPSDQIEGR